VQRTRILISNHELTLPEKGVPTPLATALQLSAQTVGTSLQYNGLGNSKSLLDQGFPLTTDLIPTRIGSQLSTARQLTFSQLLKLNNMAQYDFTDLPGVERRKALINATPPALARFLTCAVNNGDHIAPGLAILTVVSLPSHQMVPEINPKFNSKEVNRNPQELYTTLRPIFRPSMQSIHGASKLRTYK
jgi:hypothetical protein